MSRVKNRFINEGWTQETPSGSVNGSNLVFTLAFTPDDSEGVEVYLDGLLETDYSISGTTITFTTAPVAGQTVRVFYQKQT